LLSVSNATTKKPSGGKEGALFVQGKPRKREGIMMVMSSAKRSAKPMQNSHIGENAPIVSVSAQSLETHGCSVFADLKHNKNPTE